MELNYGEIADRAVAAAKDSNIVLDFSEESIEEVDAILGAYHEQLSAYEGEKGANTLWNIAVHFGIYLGETMLRLQLKEKGFAWYIDDGIPILKKDANEISPVTKAHKRILNGPEDNVKSFCDVAFMIADGKFPEKNVLRVVDVQLSSGAAIENVLRQEIDDYIMLVEEGKTDFVILSSQDGFLQFYGVNNQFVAEMRMNLQNNDFRTFSIIDKDKEHRTERVRLITPYGQFTPTQREVISLEQLKAAVRKYYENINTEDVVREIACVETTEETKKYMGIL